MLQDPQAYDDIEGLWRERQSSQVSLCDHIIGGVPNVLFVGVDRDTQIDRMDARPCLDQELSEPSRPTPSLQDSSSPQAT
jgi:hypothetical protein